MRNLRLDRLVVVNLTISGTHYWSECNIPEVHYLRNEHRHVFYIEAHKAVTHNEREVEIIMLKQQIHDYLKNKYQYEFKNMSCESIAEEILLAFELNYVKVLEDNENGAIVRL